MNVSHTIKDKEIPRWRPLQRIPAIRLFVSKLSPKRVIILLLVLATLLFFFRPSYLSSVTIIDSEERDDDVLRSLRNELRGTIAGQWDLKSTKDKVLFATAHALRNASTFTSLACSMAAAKKVDVMMIYAGINSTDTLPFFLRANRLDKASCPMVYFDARHEFATVYKQTSAVEDVLSDAVIYTNPSVVVYLEDEPDWFIQSLERATFWRRPAISLIQLRRSALPNLRWIATLSPSALMGISEYACC